MNFYNCIIWEPGNDFDLFYKEVNRVLKPDGVIAVWTYELPTISPEVDIILRDFHDNILHEYWLPENWLVSQGYSSISFPFPEMNCPQFYSERRLSLKDFMGYLNTWSATQHYITKNGINPTEELFHSLRKVWKDEEKLVSWKLVLKVGKTN